ncbi:MAG TPA: TIGR04282 family arsenosugar biosynthesis glycosyltransferase [Thermomicrobiaceae bacterium]|nr:TIGR04282 family arsenosugar biosynthesis glycosyltransferase [Thermomicrobiaceae bacterium]
MATTVTAPELLVVVAKYPTPGRVKTRLGQAIGMARSAALYRAMLLDLEERLRQFPWPHAWAFAPVAGDPAALFPPGTRCFPSGCEKLAGALRAIFARLDAAGCRRVVVISSDSPHLPLEHLTQAFAALDACDVVLGPTEDGGYYLIGQRAPSHDLFTPITMSTASVLRQTIGLCDQLGLSHALLPGEFDVDDQHDLRRLRALLASGSGADLPRTSALLEQLEELG